MSEVKHTPGSWKAAKGHDGEPERWTVVQNINPDRQWLIAVIENGAPGDFVETEGANARLIAAAPELLEALEKCLSFAESERGFPSEKRAFEANVDRIKAALTKAKGPQ